MPRMYRHYLLLLSLFIPVFSSCSSQDDSPFSFHPENYFFNSEIYFDIGGEASDFELPEVNNGQSVIIESGIVIEDSINSRNWKYNVILPSSYSDSSDKFYPVLYILHGLGSHPDDTMWSLRLNILLDYCYLNDLLQEIIVVIPDCETSYWVDDYVPGIKYESFFREIFLPTVESKYRIDTSLKRYLFGISMGGYGGAHYAFSYPDLFEYCYSASGVLDGKGVASTPSIIDTAKGKNGETLPYLTIDIGLSDPFYETNELIHLELFDLNIAHEYVERDGDHTLDFWSQSIYACLLRIGRILNAKMSGDDKNAGIKNPTADYGPTAKIIDPDVSETYDF